MLLSGVDGPPAASRVKHASPDAALVDYLKERLLTVSPTQLAPVRTLLESHKAELVPAYWQIALDDKQLAIRRFHAASALASFDPANAAWEESKFAAFVSEQLVAVSPTYVSQYQELVRPVSAKLIPTLTLIFKDPARGELARTLATSLLADYAANDPETLVELVIAADAPSDKALFPVLKKHLDVAVKRFESILDRSVKPNWHDAPLDKNWVEPDATIQASMESAHGMIGDRFAYVVDMPMDKLLDLAEKLRASGYPMPARNSDELLVIVKTYDLILWSCNHTSRFPRNHRFALGDRIERAMYDRLEMLIQAKYTRENKAILDAANLKLEILRFQMRLAKDLQCIKLNSYEFASKAIDEIGRLVGGWVRKAK